MERKEEGMHVMMVDEGQIVVTVTGDEAVAVAPTDDESAVTVEAMGDGVVTAAAYERAVTLDEQAETAG